MCRDSVLKGQLTLLTIIDVLFLMWEWKLHTHIWDAAGKWENNVNQYYSFMYIGLKQQKEAEVRGVNVCSLETAG